MARIEQINVVECIDSEHALVFEHWAEIALNKTLMVLDPNMDAYRALQAQGVLHGLGAFDTDGQMIGYSVNVLVRNHLHYSRLAYLQNDVLFVTAKKRAGRVGMQLIRATEELGSKLGAQLVMFHAKEGTALDAIMPRLGYGVQDVLYSKEV